MVTNMKDKILNVVSDRLTENRNKCEFKKAFIPEGFSCVHIEKFSKYLADEIVKELQKDNGKFS